MIDLNRKDILVTSKLVFTSTATICSGASLVVYIIYMFMIAVPTKFGGNVSSPTFPTAYLIGLDSSHIWYIDWAVLGLCALNLWFSAQSFNNMRNVSSIYTITCSIYICIFSGIPTSLLTGLVILSTLMVSALKLIGQRKQNLPSDYKKKSKLSFSNSLKITSLVLALIGVGLGAYSYKFFTFHTNHRSHWGEFRKMGAVKMPDTSKTFISFKNTGFATAHVSIIISTPEGDMNLFGCCTENAEKKQHLLDITGLNTLSSTITDRLIIPLDYEKSDVLVGEEYHFITYDGGADQFHEDKPKISKILDRFLERGSILLRYNDLDGGEWGTIQGKNMQD